MMLVVAAQNHFGYAIFSLAVGVLIGVDLFVYRLVKQCNQANNHQHPAQIDKYFSNRVNGHAAAFKM